MSDPNYQLEKEKVFCLYHLDNGDFTDVTGHTVATPQSTNRTQLDGKFGQSFSNCAFKITDLTDFPKGDFCVAFWCKYGGATQSGGDIYDTNDHGYFFKIQKVLGIRSYYSTARVDDFKSNNKLWKDINDGEWHYYTIVFMANQIAYWCDGQQLGYTNFDEGECPTPGVITFNSAFIDELMIYDGVPSFWLDRDPPIQTEPWSIKKPEFGKVYVDYNKVKCLFHFEGNLDDEMGNITLSDNAPDTTYSDNPNVNFGKYKYNWNFTQVYSAQNDDEALNKLPQGDFTLLCFTNGLFLEINAKFINDLNNVTYSGNDTFIYLRSYDGDIYHFPSEIKDNRYIVSFKDNYNAVKASAGLQYFVVQYHSADRMIYLYCNGFLIDKWQFDNVYGNQTYTALITGFKIPTSCDEFMIYDGLIYPNAINVEPSTTNQLFAVPTRDIRFNSSEWSEGDITITSDYPLYKVHKLPKALQSGYTHNIKPVVLRTEMTDGSIRQRLLNPSAPNNITCTIQLDSEQLARFKKFYETELDYGAEWFVMPIMSLDSNDISNKLVRIQNGELSIKLLHRNQITAMYQIQLKLDVDQTIEV